MKKAPYKITLILIVILVGCNMPATDSPTPKSPDAVFTEAAQTVAAELTRVALLATATPNIPTGTSTPIPTNTSIPTPPTPSNTPIPCNLASFVTDKTIPDNTQMIASQVFAKTWTIRNTGTCSWNSNYLLIFDHGDGLGVTPGYTQQLTTANINPGQTLDITVNMTAPASSGTFTGYWRMRDPGGVIFGITPTGGTFLVKIIVVKTTAVTLLPFAGSGAVHSDGLINPSEFAVGDTSDGKGIQLFLDYDISSIPANASIVEVKLDMRNGSISGDPFGGLGVLHLYFQDFLPLDASDYAVTLPGGGSRAEWSTVAALGNVTIFGELKTGLQAKLGATRFQFRLQFASSSDSDAVADSIQYLPTGGVLNNPALLVKYATP
jgi:hypothetical protein